MLYHVPSRYITDYLCGKWLISFAITDIVSLAPSQYMPLNAFSTQWYRRRVSNSLYLGTIFCISRPYFDRPVALYYRRRDTRCLIHAVGNSKFHPKHQLWIDSSVVTVMRGDQYTRVETAVCALGRFRRAKSTHHTIPPGLRW